MAFLPHHLLPSAGLGSLSQRTLPSFNQFMSSLEDMRPQRPPALMVEKPLIFPESGKLERHVPLPSPISDAPHPSQRPERGSFSHILNPVEDEANKAAATMPSASPHSPWKPIQTPRDAYEMRQGLLHGMKPLQPRGAIPPALPPATPFTLRSTSSDQDLTLAGKPRKRSAQACHRCREMKIKCRLHGSGCITCMRQGLACTFEPTKNGLRQRRSKRSPDPAADPLDGEAPPMKRTRAADSNNPEESLSAMSSRSPVAGPSGATVYHHPHPHVPTHQQRQVGTTSFPPTPPADNDTESQSTSSRRASSSTSESAHQPQHVPDLSIDTDPSLAAAALTSRALRAFYSNVHQRCGTVVVPPPPPPHEPSTSMSTTMMVWKTKSRNERMLHYAMLAAGAASCLQQQQSSKSRSQWSEEELEVALERYGRACKGVAEEALRSAGYMFDKTVVQTQMILKAVVASPLPGGGAGTIGST